MQQKRHAYARLLHAMAILKARDKATLAATQREMTTLSRENSTLYAMMGHETRADFIDPILISKRVKRNHERQHVYQLAEAEQTKALLKSSRRHERIEEKYTIFKRAEDNQIQALNMDEHISRNCKPQ